MPGASRFARRVKVLNANWVAGADGEDGQFEIMVVTDDDERHVMAPSPASTAALAALVRESAVLVWDPEDRRLIVANVVGKMPWTERDLEDSSHGYPELTSVQNPNPTDKGGM